VEFVDIIFVWFLERAQYFLLPFQKLWKRANIFLVVSFRLFCTFSPPPFPFFYDNIDVVDIVLAERCARPFD
jgi:hypothetical protein